MYISKKNYMLVNLPYIKKDIAHFKKYADLAHKRFEHKYGNTARDKLREAGKDFGSTSFMIANNIKLNAIGDLSSLPDKVKEELESIIENTKNNTGMTLTLALSYGGKQEIFKAVKEISQKVKNDIIFLDSFDDSVINDHLYTRNLPDVDLLIRTSGEQRISNFLLWQIAYAELYFTDVYWPDFTEKDFTEAIIEYQKRERRFGKTSKQL